MKDFKSTILIVATLVAGSVFSLSAQSRSEKTSSARAAYGIMPEPGKYKTNKKHKAHKQAKMVVREKSPAYRKRNNWAG